MSTTSFRLDEDLEEKLDDVASKLDRSKNCIINDALRFYIEREERRERMLQETEEGMADIEAGRTISGDEVINWLETWGSESELEAPEI